MIRGISINTVSLRSPAVVERVLKEKRRADYRHLVHAGLIHNPPTKPRNAFTAKLLDDPLICLPLKKDQSEPGPFIERLRRRQKDPAEPFGDGEPGFPGVSLKKLRNRGSSKRDEEKNKNAGSKVASANASLTVVQRNDLVRNVLAAAPSS